ncbi:hypothetical protein RR11_1452 [Ruegeria sp. R11]|nr:hypothetical protein RR11_1452 [Ruegeria sp. R11]
MGVSHHARQLAQARMCLQMGGLSIGRGIVGRPMVARIVLPTAGRSPLAAVASL